MAMPLGCRVQNIDLVVGVEVQKEALELRDGALLGYVNLGETVDGLDAGLDLVELRRVNQVRLIDDHHVGVGDLHVGRSHERAMVVIRALVALGPAGRVIQALKNVLGVDEGDDAVEVDGTAKPIVNPKQGCQIAGVGQASGLEENVVKGTLSLHQRLNGIHAGIPMKGLVAFAGKPG